MYLEILNNRERLKKIIPIVAIIFCVLGVALRFYHITRSDFVFYDEGYYLNNNRLFAELISKNYPTNFPDFCKAFYIYARFSLATGKALWFAMVDLRIFFNGFTLWFFPRVLSALAGALTFLMFYRFVKRYYGSAALAWFCLILLAIYPSHVFYSRLGMQETFCTLLVLIGFYFYIFPKEFGLRTFIAGIVFAAAFFSNYRMIILCLHIAVCEFMMTVPYGKWPNFRKFIWCMVTFFACVFLIGNIDHGLNTIITFSWMFHQAHLAQQVAFDWANIFSYPYYILRLDSPIFCAFLFGSFIFIWQKDWKGALPFVLVLLQLGMFSFAGEKGARYLCVMIPFMIMCVGALIKKLYEEKTSVYARGTLFVLILLMTGLMTNRSITLSQITSDYRNSAQYVFSLDKNVKFLSTQPYVQNLFTANRKNIESAPHTFEGLMYYYSQGFKYLVIDPQVYISWTEDEKRFNPQLHDYLIFVIKQIKPIKVFPHFNNLMLERFVFEHNEDLQRSIKFLDYARQHDVATLRVYNVEEIIAKATAMISRSQTRK